MKLNRTLIAMSAVLVSTVSFAQYGAVQYGTQYEEPEVVFDIRKTVAQTPTKSLLCPLPTIARSAAWWSMTYSTPN